MLNMKRIEKTIYVYTDRFELNMYKLYEKLNYMEDDFVIKREFNCDLEKPDKKEIEKCKQKIEEVIDDSEYAKVFNIINNVLREINEIYESVADEKTEYVDISTAFIIKMLQEKLKNEGYKTSDYYADGFEMPSGWHIGNTKYVQTFIKHQNGVRELLVIYIPY